MRRLLLSVLAACWPAAAAAQDDPGPASSASAALEAFLAEAARINASVPEPLRGYRATVESEMSIVLIDSAGRERAAQIEQIASEVRWRAPDRYDQRVIGYRTQAIGPTVSLMNMVAGWTTPTLYGNRLRLGIAPNSPAAAPARRTTAGMTTHPLSPVRQRFYTFSGGDTAVVLYSRGRRIPVVRVRVTPREDVTGDALLFSGDLHIDAERRQIAAMHGRLIEFRGGRPVSAGGRLLGAGASTFIDMVNVEVDGDYWLPATQRTEFHARVAAIGEFRVVVRVVSRFGDYRTNDSSWVDGVDAPGTPHHLTVASSGDLARYAGWWQPIGAARAAVDHSDFGEHAPAGWHSRPDASSGTRFSPETASEVFRFNRIEGVFTGVALERALRDSAPGLRAYASLGWAWAEQTPRGTLKLVRTGRDWTAGVRAHRTLAHTNDFQLPLSWGATLPALLGSMDDFDYADRRGAELFAERRVGAHGRSLLRLETGIAADLAVERNVRAGLFVEGNGFRENRGVWPGRYARTAATLELNPRVTGMFADRGASMRIRYERADGGLNWQRLEARTAVRRELGPISLYGRADGGILFGEPAPQTLFEVGSSEGLSAYGYKEFAGDRAALARGVIGYSFPVLRAPLRLPGGILAPGLAPGIAAGIHAAWTDISGPAAERALLGLGSRVAPDGSTVPLARATDGVRASAELMLTFFGGAAGIGVSRRVDSRGPWRFTARIGPAF